MLRLLNRPPKTPAWVLADMTCDAAARAASPGDGRDPGRAVAQERQAALS